MLFLKLIFTSLSAQDNNAANWNITSINKLRFIENKGQFDVKNRYVHDKILFGTEGNLQVFFTPNGIQYCLNYAKEIGWYKKMLLEKEELKKFKGNIDKYEREKAREREMLKAERKISNAKMEWIGANPNCEIIALDTLTEYFAYSNVKEKSTQFSRGFKKIIYKNLYPNIDVIYEVEEDGWRYKYSIVLWPGADISLLRMHYSGDAKLKLNENGELSITCHGHEIVESLPFTFYDKNKEEIKSAFMLKNNEVTFLLADYNRNEKVVIDPWVQTGSNNNCTPINIEKDAVGNIYVLSFYGSQPSHMLNTIVPLTVYLSKFSAVGVLLWSLDLGNYNSVYNNVSGDIAVHPSGDVYVTNNFQIIPTFYQFVSKINTNGAVIYDSDLSSIILEVPELAFSCDYSRLTIGGCNHGYNEMACAEMNQTTGTANIVYSDTLNYGDVRSTTYGKNGYYYAICISQKIWNGQLVILNSQNGYSFVASQVLNGVLNEFNTATNFASNGCAPFNLNAIVASCKYLYIYLGDTLEQRDLLTGAVLKKVCVPHGIYLGNMGIDVDDCGNVYVGTSKGIAVYSDTLNQLTFLPTSEKIYDVLVDEGGLIYGCGGQPGINFGTSLITQFKYNAPCNDTVIITQNNLTCNSSSATATATATFCSAPYTYLWSDGQTTQTASNLSPGKYTVVVTGAGNCAHTDSASVIILPAANSMVLSATKTDADCSSLGTATVSVQVGSAPYSYLWSNGQSTNTVTNLAVGNYNVVVTDAKGCSKQEWISIGKNNAAGSANSFIKEINVFTPNGDGNNDVFEIVDPALAGTFKKFNIQVWDRWGLKVFESNQPLNSWDGKYNGDFVASGVYYFVVQYDNNCIEGMHEKTGWVQVIR